ncbi:indole-3-acetate O-methyltransferase [Salvia divinorum]|uniref:Indole-3-acetate O-methyltransferase n=1 Tax=Salvia divinorum TaxID=28513 RepID=A0ABD1GJT9_SALDI
MAESISPMNGGSGRYSYARNSTWQRNWAHAVEDSMKEAIMENLDLQKVVCDSNTLVVADLGCSVGPNTFYAVESIIEAVQRMYCNKSRQLEFQVMFNDRMGNDFNTLFASLPEHGRNYSAAAVAASFYGRVFPPSSIHIAYSLAGTAVKSTTMAPPMRW